ncbi:AraC family transcriptional regulator [Pelobium manganitolerans]|uniref:AraC family transcriptional regulator n=1 Tax=Pelobium manganitolerans TaxID=1842495 RepID=A0A419SAY8_9SPHI|nr:AraC family transcriptional regulator [Pelobium manganitolerans]RKD19621.1 AraC family transcriptional regulator [Pelobium manganitolerans]
MKPLFHKVSTNLHNSFGVKHNISPSFGKTWHFHPELELHYVIKGEGVRFVGDNISNFSEGELVLLGENLPHTWRCSDEYHQNGAEDGVEAIVIQFLPECFGKDFLALPETFMLPKLFEKAKRGMVINGEAKEKVVALMKQSTEADRLNKLIILLEMLNILAHTDDYEEITSAHAFYKSNESDSIRLNKIYSYTLSNYKNDITLHDVATIGNLSVTSFCRYFKLMTNKTFYDFLIEIRVSHACRLLIEDKMPTEMICFECGFNNVSNFYRHFKRVAGITPLDYKKRYLLN